MYYLDYYHVRNFGNKYIGKNKNKIKKLERYFAAMCYSLIYNIVKIFFRDLVIIECMEN